MAKELNSKTYSVEALLSFRNTAKTINTYLKDTGVALNFKGYKDTIVDYINLKENDINSAYILTKECNLWANYLGEVKRVVEIIYEQELLSLDLLKAEKISRVDNPELEEKITKQTRRCYHYRLFIRQLKTQTKFFIKAYFHCSNIANTSRLALLYSSN